jgi:uncharacterized membrane protein
MLFYLILLRFIHIGGGVFWAGVSIYLAAFVLPASRNAGPAGGRFMQQLSMTNKLPMVMIIIPTLTVIAGLLLIWEVSAGLQAAWMGSSHGILLQSGATAALISYIIGFAVNRPAIMKMAAIGKQLAGNPPTEEQAKMLGMYNKKLTRGTNIIAILLTATVVTMSVVRYF